MGLGSVHPFQGAAHLAGARRAAGRGGHRHQAQPHTLTLTLSLTLTLNPKPTPNPNPTRNSQAGIGIKPAYCFTDVVTPATDYFRVGYGEASFPRSLEALAAFVHKHRQAWRIRSSL